MSLGSRKFRWSRCRLPRCCFRDKPPDPSPEDPASGRVAVRPAGAHVVTDEDTSYDDTPAPVVLYAAAGDERGIRAGPEAGAHIGTTFGTSASPASPARTGDGTTTAAAFGARAGPAGTSACGGCGFGEAASRMRWK